MDLGLFFQFLQVFLGLVAVPAAAPVLAVFIDFLKKVGLPDGFAPLVSGLVNVAVYAILFFAGKENTEMVGSFLDAFVLVAPYIFALFLSLVATAKAHDVLTPMGYGYSHPK